MAHVANLSASVQLSPINVIGSDPKDEGIGLPGCFVVLTLSQFIIT
jgi:hypothetical protein